MVQPVVQSLPGFIARTILSASSSAATSLQGIDCTSLEDGACCFVREEPLGTPNGGLYRYFASSARVPASPTVITANGGGQWLLESARSKMNLKAIEIGTGGTAPTSAEAGPTRGWLFAIGDLGYQEFGLEPNVDRSAAIILGFSWAPAGAEVGKVVSWQLDVCKAGVGKDISAIDTTKSLVDVAVGAVAAIYVHSAFTLTPAEWGGADAVVDELHVRLQRIASTTDPVSPPGVHHIICIQPLL